MSSAEGKNRKAPAAKRGGWRFLAGVVVLYGVVYLIDPAPAVAGLADFARGLRRLLPFFGFMLVLLWLFNRLIEPRKVVKSLGKQSGLRGWLLAMSGGMIAMGPMTLWYPLLAELHSHGLRPALAAAFLYTRAIKIPMLPFMAHYFGGLYTVLFVIYILLFSVVIGWLMERLGFENSQAAGSDQ